MGITANVSPLVDKKAGFQVVTWPNVPNGNQGDPYEVSGWLVTAVDLQGTLGAGFAARLEGTNDPNGNPAVWGAIPHWTFSAAGLFLPSVDSNPVFVRFIRPNITGGDGTTSVTFRAQIASQYPT